jgi:hypothetical protein
MGLNVHETIYSHVLYLGFTQVIWTHGIAV